MKKSPRCLYNNNIKTFVAEDEKAILGQLCENFKGVVLPTTMDAWVGETAILKQSLLAWKDNDGQIIFEYDIPRLGKRIDVVILLKGIVFCLEFKVGESNINECDVDQVLDYALDLKNFHLYSQDKLIVPILIATKHKTHSSIIQPSIYDDRVVNPLTTGEAGIAELIKSVLQLFPNETDVNENWLKSPYSPTPTII